MTRFEEIKAKVAVGTIYPVDVAWLIENLDRVLLEYNEYRTKPYEYTDSYGMITKMKRPPLVL